MDTQDPNTVTTPRFWDCECEEHFIKPKSQSFCPTCGSRRDDQPDARLNEARAMLERLANAIGTNCPEQYMDCILSHAVDEAWIYLEDN
jgi:hypothetical protein